jgi:hypothetical protein
LIEKTIDLNVSTEPLKTMDYDSQL